MRIILAPLQHRYRSMPDCVVLGTATGRVVCVDPRGQAPARTLLHELLHVRHPSWSESRIRQATAQAWRTMGWRAKAHLYRMLGGALIEGNSS